MEHLKMRLNQLLEKKIELDNYLAKQLPKSILQEAIQGKLVPQIAEEGTAQELLDQIKAEKQKRVNDGKLKKSALNGSVIFRGDDNKYYNMNATAVNTDTTVKEDSIVGQLEFRGKIGKTIDEKKSKKGEPYQMFSAYSATKVENGFEYIWVRLVRFNKERESWFVPGCRITAKGELELSLYNDRLTFSCKVDELAEYVPQPYNPNA